MKTNKGKSRIIFKVTAPSAETASVVGDFNDWDETRHPMHQKVGGVWEKAVMLHAGRYEYKFKIDGCWECDPDNARCCSNPFGTTNNIVVVNSSK